MSPVLYPGKGKKRHILRSLSALIHDRVWHQSLSGTSPVTQDKESQFFAITDKKNCFACFHIGKEINFCSTATFLLIFVCVAYGIILQNSQTSKNTQYSKYAVRSCEARKAVRWKSQIPQGFQDLAKIIPLGARFEEKLTGSCTKLLSASEGGRIRHGWKASLCKSERGGWALLLHSCCQQ